MKYKVDPCDTGFKLGFVELPSNSDMDYEGGNLGHRVGTQKATFSPAAGTAQDMRSEMLAAMAKMGCVVEKHHSEWRRHGASSA